MEFKENWHTVVKALEKIIPNYEEVNRYLSLGYAEKARIYAVNSAHIESNFSVLDAGIGPGSLSKIVVSRFDPIMLVGFDFSTKMLKAAAEKLATVNSNKTKTTFNSLEAFSSVYLSETKPLTKSSLRFPSETL